MSDWLTTEIRIFKQIARFLLIANTKLSVLSVPLSCSLDWPGYCKLWLREAGARLDQLLEVLNIEWPSLRVKLEKK